MKEYSTEVDLIIKQEEDTVKVDRETAIALQCLSGMKMKY